MAKRSAADKELDAIIAREDLFRKLIAAMRPSLTARYAAQYGVTIESAQKCQYGAVLEPVLLDFRENLDNAHEMVEARLPEVAAHYRLFLDQCAAIDPNVAYNPDHAEKFLFVMHSAIEILREQAASNQHKDPT
jgi:hypothetical protein